MITVADPYHAYRRMLEQPAPIDPNTIPTQRDVWVTRKLIAVAAKQALADVLIENGTPLETPLKLVVKGESVTLRLFRLSEDDVSVSITAQDWSA